LTVPSIRYARSDELHIAYQQVGDGPLDLVFVPGAWSHLEVFWEEPSVARFLRRLSGFSRLILFDKRGTGLSDRVAVLPTLEQRMDDVRAVMDAVGSERAALLGVSEGGPMCALFAATYPRRTTRLVLLGSTPRLVEADDYPCGRPAELTDRFLEQIERGWGQAVSLPLFAPSAVGDERLERWFGRLERLGASPGAAVALTRMAAETDVRHLLPSISVPTLILHRTGDRVVPVKAARYLAERIPESRYVELPGNDHFPWFGEQEPILAEIEEFLTGARPFPETDRFLATVLFTDIAGSTERIAQVGDRQWRGLLEAHHDLVRRELDRYRGQEVDTAGDGFFATFDGPARAVRCALGIRAAVRPLGLEIRAGVHAGECEKIGGKTGGLAVHIGARVAGVARPGEVIVSSTVKDLVAGSGLRFVDRGTHELEGIPDGWRLFAADETAA
jgi:pimeloyl-ACP methyl ester carboxylesterase/class 3 adenylate cyclase